MNQPITTSVTVFDFSGYSIEQLIELEQAVINQRLALEIAHLKHTRRQIDALIKQSGLSLDVLFPELRVSSDGKYSASHRPQAKHSPRAQAPVKFVHPQQPAFTWSGRGIQPVWLRTYLQQGGNLEDCRVAPFSVLPYTWAQPALSTEQQV